MTVRMIRLCDADVVYIPNYSPEDGIQEALEFDEDLNEPPAGKQIDLGDIDEEAVSLIASSIDIRLSSSLDSELPIIENENEEETFTAPTNSPKIDEELIQLEDPSWNESAQEHSLPAASMPEVPSPVQIPPQSPISEDEPSLSSIEPYSEELPPSLPTSPLQNLIVGQTKNLSSFVKHMQSLSTLFKA